jgi:chemotaxis protein MotB
MTTLRFKSLGFVIVLTFLGALAGGCQSKIQEENAHLWQQNRELQARLNEANERLKSSPDSSQLASMQQEIAKRDAEIADLQASLRQPATGASAASTPGLEGINAKYDAKAGTVTVTLPGKVLFDAGQANLKTSSQSTLDKIAAAIKKSYPGHRVYVDGHTDSDPITKTKGQWEDNLDLSAARAMAVTRYLAKHGLSSKQVVPRAYGENNPKGSKEESRRVEIVVLVK